MASDNGSEGGCSECRLTLPVKETFDLEKAVCSYGFFMMAPNLWFPSTCTLQRPLRLRDNRSVMAQVGRMLRLSETEESAISRFHELHPEAKAKGFGRLFRSPTLFEDMVKGILLCNCGWGRTLAMVRSLCDLQSEMKKLGIGKISEGVINSGNQGKIGKKSRKTWQA
jgi:hypothetical protein